MKRAKHAPKKTAVKKSDDRSADLRNKSASEMNDDVHELVHLLQVSQIELEHQNHELRITEQELEASRNKYVNLFDFSPIPYFALDQDGIIKKVNLNGGKMLGIDRSKLIGKKFVSYISPEEKNTINTFINSTFNSSIKQSCKAKVVNKDNRMFHVLLEGVRLDDTPDLEQRCQIALIDLTEYRKLEEANKKMSEELRLLKTSKR